MIIKTNTRTDSLMFITNMTTRRQNINGNTFVFTLKNDRLSILFTDGFTVCMSTICGPQGISGYRRSNNDPRPDCNATLNELFSCKQVQYINGGLGFNITAETDGTYEGIQLGQVHVAARVIFPDTAELLNGVDGIDNIDEIKRTCSRNMQILLRVMVKKNSVDANDD